jgi:hypothetical protein
MYVVGWIIEFHTIMPDFLERYITFTIRELQKSNLSPEKMAYEIAQYESYRHNYDTLGGMIAMTYVEILPVGIMMALITAFTMKKK